MTITLLNNQNSFNIFLFSNIALANLNLIYSETSRWTGRIEDSVCNDWPRLKLTTNLRMICDGQ